MKSEAKQAFPTLAPSSYSSSPRLINFLELFHLWWSIIIIDVDGKHHFIDNFSKFISSFMMCHYKRICYSENSQNCEISALFPSVQTSRMKPPLVQVKSEAKQAFLTLPPSSSSSSSGKIALLINFLGPFHLWWCIIGKEKSRTVGRSVRSFRSACHSPVLRHLSCSVSWCTVLVQL